MTTQPKFTPGPWTIGGYNMKDGPAPNGQNYVDGRHQLPICNCSPDGVHALSVEQRIVNARFISAAPEMYAELLRAEDELSSALRDGFEKHFTSEMLQRWLNGVRAALAKSGGQ